VRPKHKKIDWTKFFEINDSDPLTLQIIPDRTVKNNQLDILTKSLWEVFIPLHSRFTRKGFKITYQKQPNLWWEVYFTASSVTFYLTVPKSHLGMTRQRINTVWPRATVQPISFSPSFDQSKTDVLQVNLKHHNFLSLDPDRRENAPLPYSVKCHKRYY